MSNEKLGEMSEIRRHRGSDRIREGRLNGKRDICQKLGLGRTTEDDRQMREAALLSLSSHSVLLSIREEHIPSSVPYCAPSFSVRLPQFDWSTTLRGKW